MAWFTSKCRHESLNTTAQRSHGKIAHDGSVKCDREPKADHDQSSHSQVHQDKVERLPQFLVLSCDQQGQTIDGESSADQEKHVESQQLEQNWICQVILGVVKRAPHKSRPIVHRNVEVLALCAVLHLCKLVLGLSE